MQIELGFLMVGHTHEDIDALFGHVSMWLRKHDALTLPGELFFNTNVRVGTSEKPNESPLISL